MSLDPSSVETPATDREFDSATVAGWRSDAPESPPPATSEKDSLATDDDRTIPGVADHQRSPAKFDAGADPKTDPLQVNSTDTRESKSETTDQHYAGERIDRYQLVEQVGEGGMGTVWKANQLWPVQRRVAIKLMKSQEVTNEMIQRFRDEQKILASLTHSGIATLLDAGVSDREVPYLVMEFAEGSSITSFCHENQLTIHQRVQLVGRIAEALQHAHEKSIVHRDLKPGNVLVTGDADRPEFKIIDFGISKLLSNDNLEKDDRSEGSSSQLTVAGHILGTPQFMSPEQASLDQSLVDSRSDVYALGVILYQLITDKLPIDTHGWKSQPTIQELLQAVVEHHPPRPSRLIKQASNLNELASNRSTSPKYLVRQLRQDLDWLCLTALEKDISRRYQSATEMANDIRRWINVQPLQARRPTTGYRLKKWFQRRRSVAILSIALGLTLLSAGGVLFGTNYFRHQKARHQLAVAESDARQRINETKQQIQRLASFRSAATQLSESEMEQLLIDWNSIALQLSKIKSIRGQHIQLAEMDPEIEQIHDAVSTFHAEREVYHQVKKGIETAMTYDPVLQSYSTEKGLTQIASAILDKNNNLKLNSLSSAFQLDVIESIHFYLAESRVVLKENPLSEAQQPLDHRLIQFANQIDPNRWRVRLRNAAARLDEDELESLLPAEDQIDLQPPFGLLLWADALARSGSVDAGMNVLQKAQRRFSDNVWLTQYLGKSFMYIDEIRDYSTASRYLTAAVSLSPKNAIMHQALGEALYHMGEIDAARDSCLRALQIQPDFVVAKSFLANTYLKENQLEKAETLYREILQENAENSIATGALAVVLHQQGKAKEAEVLFRKAIRSNPNDEASNLNLIRFLQAENRNDEALKRLREVAGQKDSIEIQRALGMALIRAGKPAAAIAPLRSVCRSVDSAESHYDLALAHHHARQYEPAIEAYNQALKRSPDHQLARQGLQSAKQWLKAKSK